MQSDLADVLRHTKRFKALYGNLHCKLEALQSLVGMELVKKQVVEQLQFLLCNDGATDGHYLHTVIQGPSGCGKSTLARVLFELWSEMQVFTTRKFTVLHRSDLVGGYMGQTAAKTKKTLMQLKGGCIFIDEFYSLVYGNDAYGRECVDVLNTFMSEEKDTVVIVAGYEGEMQRVFSAQPGLERRFAWKFTVPKYTAEELYHIFVQQLSAHDWQLDDPPAVLALFQQHADKFNFAGGDTLNLCLKSKIHYAKSAWKQSGNKRIRTASVEAAIRIHFVEKNSTNNMYI